MTTFYDKFDFAWPWIGLGIALPMLVILFFTNIFRRDITKPFYKDYYWWGWITVPLYLLHQFEEYALHIDVSTMSYKIVEDVCRAQYAGKECLIPVVHYPVVNIALAWLAAPIAAFMGKRNPMMALTFYGFVLVNGIVHLLTVLVIDKVPLYESPGAFTGIFLFIPISIWISYVHPKNNVLTGKEMIISMFGGVVGHIGLFLAYQAVKISGPMTMLVTDVIVVFLPILIVYPLSRRFRNAT